MAPQDERQLILGMLESGKISAEQAISLLAALDEASPGAESAVEEALVEGMPETDLPVGEIPAAPVQPAAVLVETLPPASSAAPELPEEEQSAGSQAGEYAESLPGNKPPTAEQDSAIGEFRSWWRFPLWAGVAVTVIGATLMYLAWRSGGFGFWFACTWFPFLFGVTIMALAWSSRRARWLHVRVHRQPGETPQRIFISMPLPLRLAAWAVRIFHIRTPELDQASLANLIMSLEKTSPEAPLYIHVNDSADGERVEVYIG